MLCCFNFKTCLSTFSLQINIRDLDTYKTLVYQRSFMAKWVLLNAAEDLEPNLLSIVVTRNKIDFLEGKSFPEFSTVLQQKWEIFGKRLMTFWFITVMMVFVLFQVYLSNLLDEIKDASNASKHQHNISYVLYIIAGSFLLLDTLFEYSLGVVRSQEELDNAVVLSWLERSKNSGTPNRSRFDSTYTKNTAASPRIPHTTTSDFIMYVVRNGLQGNFW